MSFTGVSNLDHDSGAVITAAEAEKLRSIRSGAVNVLSVYLPVPSDPAHLPGLPALAADLIDAAVTASDQAGTLGSLSDADRDEVQRLVEAHGRDWLGQTAAIFACGQLGLLEVLRLPGQLPARAVLEVRPHTRPLLAFLQRHPSYLVAIVDRRHSWLLSVAGDRVETIARHEEQAMRSRGLGGWYGLDAQRLQRRMTQLADHHYRSLAGMLEDRQAAGDCRPVVVGGHEDCVRRLIGALPPPAAAAALAGSFTADARTLTRARARELADPVIGRWVVAQEHKLAAEIQGAACDGRAVIGLAECLGAVNAGAANLLLIPEEGLVPGFVCGRCGALTGTGSECPDWGAAARPIPDLLEEMAAQVLDDGGQVFADRGLPTVAVRLRYALTRGR
jgi:hypothetical protein